MVYVGNQLNLRFKVLYNKSLVTEYIDKAMDIYEKEYYNQPSLWNTQAEAYQVQLLADILSLLPEDTHSILDVGCGNGIITNVLPKNIHVVGLDSSTEALKTVVHETVVGSIANLPFADNSFDLVMANDVIEHLPEEVYIKSISELFRVASKYVLISVPHAEQLEKALTKCADCGSRYHINHHQRSLFEDGLVEICPLFWKINEIRYSGDITRYPLDKQYSSLLQDLEINIDWNNGICPNCGSSKTLKYDLGNTHKILGHIRSKAFFKNGLSFINQHIDRSEIIALYTKEAVSYSNKVNKYININSIQHLQKSPLLLDFKNPFQQVNQGFVEGCFWTKYFNRIKDKEIANKNTENTDLDQDIIICFPVIPQVNDKILIKTLESITENIIIHVIAHDEINNFSIPIPNSYVKNSNELEYTIDSPFKSSLYGTPISIQVIGNINLQSIEYLPSHEQAFKADFIKINIGHNILVNTKNNYYRSWGLLADTPGYYPTPEWLWNDSLNLCCEVFSNISVNDYIHTIEGKIQTQEIQINQIQEKYAKLLFKTRGLSVNRILVLSHMFPNEAQINSGCFIAEQVKALREHEGLDVRVISCQPFWIHTKNPFKVLDRISEYKKCLYSSMWSSWNDIPVLRIPYLVGRPFFPFHVHGFTYQYSVARWANQIHKSFNFDLIHAHTSYLDGFTGSYLAKKYQTPLLITEHTGPFSVLSDRLIVRQVAAKALQSANKIISVSPTLENELIKIISPFHQQKIICIPNGVDTELFYPDQNNNKNNDFLMLLSVISLDDNKNPFCLLEAFKILHIQGIKIKLNILGGGELQQQLQQFIDKNNLTQFINLLGWQPRHEVARMMREICDIFVLPSRSETFGVVVIEAMASGKPVVSTRCGGPESVIIEPYLGELCANDDPQSLASTIKKVADNLNKYDFQKIRNHIFKKYDFKVIVDKINSIYQNC